MGASRPFFLRGEFREETVSTTFARERTLQDEIAPAVEQRVPGVEVLAVELLSPTRFCVFIDHPAGVDHALCERVTRVLDTYRADWTIDVSSPGPERPLRTREHFDAVAGARVAVRTSVDIEGRTRFRGVVGDVGDEAVELELTDGEMVQVPYESIVRGNLIDEGLTT
jgi:ribosome maturation factor RimP